MSIHFATFFTAVLSLFAGASSEASLEDLWGFDASILPSATKAIVSDLDVNSGHSPVFQHSTISHTHDVWSIVLKYSTSPLWAFLSILLPRTDQVRTTLG